MKKYIISIVCALCAICGTAWAGPVDSEDAKQKAAAFLQKQAAHTNNARRAAALRSPQLTEAKAFGDALHVFNIGGDNGFVIVSGDDRTEEILGYVEGGSFDANNMPDNMRFWLQMYADQIRSLGSSEVKQAPRRAERAAVAPVVTTHWDQHDPFNNYILDDIPEQDKYYHDQLMTGCVATSMAQAIYRAAKNYKDKHGSWPTIATNTIPEYKNSESGTTTYNVTFPELPEFVFDWENMREDNYSTLLYTDITPEQIKAVGKLMQYCGRAMKMEYDKVNSASVFVWAGARMYDCLNLSKFVQSVDRAYYTSQDWEDMMYKEVSEGRAVCYSANVSPSTSSEGHAFILDGYKDGLFHINWGWGKSVTDTYGHPKADGYFSLSVMQPMAAGSGSASVLEAEYKYLQQAIINVSYDDPEGGVSALNFYWNGKNVYTSSIGGWGAYNVLGATLTFEEGWAIRNADGTITDNIWNKTTEHEYTSIGVNSGTTTYFSDMTLPTEDGDYDIVHISREKGTSTWHASYGTDKNYVTITISGGKVTKAVAHPVDISKDVLSLKNIDFIGDMEANKDNTVKVTIENMGDDFFGTLAMYYSTGSSVESTKKYEQLATIKPGETTHEFTVNLPKGEYKLWFFVNPSSYPYASDAFATSKMFIGYGADANKIQAGNLVFDGQEGATTLSVKSVNGQLAPVTGKFDVTNNSSNTYKNTYYVAVEYNKTTYATAEVPVEVAANTTETIAFDLGTVTGLNSTTTYTVRLYSKSGNEEVTVATKEMKLQSYFRYWLADGTMKDAQEPTYSVKLPEDAKTAFAIDCRGLSSTSYMDDIANKNCLFYITANQKPTSSYNPIYGRNLVIDGVAEKMTVDAAYGFYAPEAFTAKEVSYARTFANGNNDDGKGWETIVLPFEVNSVKQGTKNLKWFKSANDKRCHFWLMELTGATSDALTFDYATTFEANKPYIVSVPGNKWGDNWNLVGKEIAFRGVNVDVPVTVLEPVVYGGKEFTPTFTTITANGYILNADGTKFAKGEGTVKGYNAYFAGDAASANALQIVINGQETDGIDTINNEEELRMDNQPVYNLNGQRLEQKQRGVNIVGGRKIVVK